MKYCLLIVAIFISTLSFSQDTTIMIIDTTFGFPDEIDFDRDDLSTITQKKNVTSDSYIATSTIANLTFGDYTKFNADHGPEGFSELSGPAWSLGYGFSSKKNRRVFDLNWSFVGLNKKASSPSESIRTRFSLLEMTWGYDLVKHHRFNLYPYAGLGMRKSTLVYRASRELNAGATNATDIMVNNRSFKSDFYEFSGQAGLGLEIQLGPSSSSGLMLVLRGGTSYPVKEKSFDIDGVRYDPQFGFGKFYGMIGIKNIARK